MSNVKIVASTQMFISTLKKCNNEQQIVICCEEYTNIIHKQLKMKISDNAKRKIVKTLAEYVVANLFKANSNNDSGIDHNKDVDTEDYEANDINEKDIKENNKFYLQFRNSLSKRSIYSKFRSILVIISGIYAFPLKSKIMNLFIIANVMSGVGNLLITNDGKNKKNSREEYYCDLFSGMYGLPVTFRYLFRKNKVSTTANNLTNEQLRQVYDAERLIEKYDPHPTSTARNYAGYQIAKQFIDKDDIAPELNDYCQWVIDNFSSTDDIDIEKNHHSRIFNPSECKYINKHLTNIVNNTKKLTVTEYDLPTIKSIGKLKIFND